MSASKALLDWNNQGLLPAILPAAMGTGIERSPYVMKLSQLINRFGTSPERLNILKGFLDYRKELHSVGLTKGFQWLNGSFVENIEAIESRSPNDIDVVTFPFLIEDESQTSVYSRKQILFDKAQNKKKYKVDSYYVFFDLKVNLHFIEKVAYWYSMWSHTRKGVWKGFVQLDLDPTEDAEALSMVNSLLEANYGH